MSSHPNFFDRLALKIYPGYLYPGQICKTLGPVNIGMIHKLPDVAPRWKIMDYLYLRKGSSLKYLGLAKSLKIQGEIEPTTTILELILPDIDENKSSEKHVSPGDLIAITPNDRQYISASNTNDDFFDKISNIIAPTPKTDSAI